MVFCLFLQAAIFCLIIWLKSSTPFSVFFNTFSETFFLVITTRSSIICLPHAINSLKKQKYLEVIVDMYMPFGVTLIRLGTMCFFAISTLFIMSIFEVPITINQCVFITFTTTLAGMSTADTSGIVSLQMISIVLNPLGLPHGGVLAILVAIDAVVDLILL